MGVAPDPDIGDATLAQARTQRIGVDLLRTIASPKRPVVFFVDDLQWAARTPLGFIDMLVSEGLPDGLLLVAAFRDDAIDSTHPLSAMLQRWQRQPVPPDRIRLGNLPTACAGELVADILRLPRRPRRRAGPAHCRADRRQPLRHRRTHQCAAPRRAADPR